MLEAGERGSKGEKAIEALGVNLRICLNRFIKQREKERYIGSLSSYLADMACG